MAIGDKDAGSGDADRRRLRRRNLLMAMGLPACVSGAHREDTMEAVRTMEGVGGGERGGISGNSNRRRDSRLGVPLFVVLDTGVAEDDLVVSQSGDSSTIGSGGSKASMNDEGDIGNVGKDGDGEVDDGTVIGVVDATSVKLLPISFCCRGDCGVSRPPLSSLMLL